MADKKKLKKIVGELNKASKTHASQADRIGSMLKKTSPALAKISASCKAQAKRNLKCGLVLMLLAGVYVVLEVILKRNNV